MINSPEANLVLPTDLQNKIDLARTNLSLIEEQIKLKMAAKEAEQYTVSQLLIQEDSLRGKIKELEKESERLVKENEDLSAEDIVLLDRINKSKIEAETIIKEAKLKNDSADARNKDCLAKEDAILKKEEQIRVKEAKLEESAKKLSKFVEKIKDIINELPL